jgi:hypothetical protein
MQNDPKKFNSEICFPTAWFMLQIQCSWFAQIQKYGYRKECFLVCPPLGNMASKQCFLVCQPLGNLLGNNVSWLVNLWETWLVTFPGLLTSGQETWLGNKFSHILCETCAFGIYLTPIHTNVNDQIELIWMFRILIWTFMTHPLYVHIHQSSSLCSGAPEATWSGGGSHLKRALTLEP